MLLSQSCDDLELEHPFIYTHMLGIYHANVIHKSTTIGPHSYTPMQMEFLFVRWFPYQGSTNVQWANLKLDPLSFMLVHSENAFGFVDPSDILRGCHILPWFQEGKVHTDQQGMSRAANDKNDWCEYQLNW